MPSTDFTLSNDSGVQLSEVDRSLDSYGLKGDATIFISSKYAFLPQAQAQADHLDKRPLRPRHQLDLHQPSTASQIQMQSSRECDYKL